MELNHNAIRLATMCAGITYREGWEISFTREGGLPALKVKTLGPDTSRVGSSRTPLTFRTTHFFEVPETPDMDYPVLERWVLDRIIDVETHEILELFKIDGVAPFFPNHEVGSDLYEIRRK